MEDCRCLQCGAPPATGGIIHRPGCVVGAVQQGIGMMNGSMAELSALRAEREAVQKELTGAWGYASRLFKSLAPHCEPLDHIIGVLTQIDNWSTGVCPTEERDALAEKNKSLGEALRRCESNYWQCERKSRIARAALDKTDGKGGENE